LFELHLSRPPGVTYRFWSGDRHVPEEGSKVLEGILNTRLTCPQAMPAEACSDVLASFRDACKHARVKTEADFMALGQDIARETAEEVELGRLFYLSVPPSAYGSIAGNVHTHCR